MKEFKEVFTAQDWKDLDEFEMERAYWANKAKQKPCDTLTQYSWPEEKPEHNKEYLIRTRDKCEHYDYVGYRIATWKEKLTASERQTTYGLERKGGFEPGFFEMDDNMYWFTVDNITHRWELPEVRE